MREEGVESLIGGGGPVGLLPRILSLTVRTQCMDCVESAGGVTV